MSNDATLLMLKSLLNEAEADFLRCQKNFETAKKKLAGAEGKFDTLKEAVAKITATTDDGKPHTGFQELVRSIIFDSGSDGISAADIQKHLERDGHGGEVKNLSAAVHVAAKRLVEQGVIDLLDGPGFKIFRKAAASKPQSNTQEDDE